MKVRKAAFVLALVLTLCLALSACGKYSAESLSGAFTQEQFAELEKYEKLTQLDARGSDCYEEIVAYIAAHPQVQVIYDVDIGGTRVPGDSAELDLTQLEYDAETLCARAKYLPNVKKLNLGAVKAGDETPTALTQAFPEAQTDFTVSVGGKDYPSDTVSVDLCAMSGKDAAAAAETLALMPKLKEINLIKADGSCSTDIKTLAALKKALPEVKLRCSFELFGKTVSSEDETIEYDGVNIGNDGVKQIREVLPYLSACKYMLLADCGIDNEVLAQLKSDFPDTKIVWRIYIYSDAYLTDTDRLMTVRIDDWHIQDVKYLTDVRYIDVGHQNHISDFSFVQYMPKLEVLIAGKTGLADLTPLTYCKELNYLEIFTTQVTDLSPLKECPKLEYLDICYVKGLSDLSVLEEMPQLKRVYALWMDNVPEENFAAVQAKMPDCEILYTYPGYNQWRYNEDGSYTERYAKLREQMGYTVELPMNWDKKK